MTASVTLGKLLQHPEVPMTSSKNQGNAMHLLAGIMRSN